MAVNACDKEVVKVKIQKPCGVQYFSIKKHEEI